MRDYLLLIRKNSFTHIDVCSIHMKEVPPLSRDLSLETSNYQYLCFWLSLLKSASNCSFWSYFKFSILLYLRQIRLPQPTFLLKSFFFEDFNFYHKNWLTYSVDESEPAELCCNYSPKVLFRLLLSYFPTRIPNYDTQCPGFFLILFFIFRP